MHDPKTPDLMPLQGEGDYISARKFDGAGKLRQERQGLAAKEAEEALDSPEGEDLERARETTGRGETGKRP
jgi:hypothetical protein